MYIGADADAGAQNAGAWNKQVIFRNFAPFTNCISKINNTRIVKGKGLDIMKSMYSRERWKAFTSLQD